MRKITYVKDLPVSSPRGSHWLSLEHGPPPDFIGLVAYRDVFVSETFRCAMWIMDHSISVQLEMMDRSRTCQEETWIRTFLHGWILQSYYWRRAAGGMQSGDVFVPNPEGDGEEAIRAILIGSVNLATQEVEECSS